MTKEEITDGNILIARFMGDKYYPPPVKRVVGRRKEVHS